MADPLEHLGTDLRLLRNLEHQNDRVYEIQLTAYGGAAREWRKDLAMFWRKLKITK